MNLRTIVLVVALGILLHPSVTPKAVAAPWPVSQARTVPVTDQVIEFNSFDEDGNLAVDEEGNPLFEELSITVSTQPILERQRVNQTFCAPRGWEGTPSDPDATPSPYLHNGIDIRAPNGTRVFTSAHGQVTAIRPSGDFEAIKVGEFRYMHIGIAKRIKETVEDIDDNKERQSLLGRLNIQLPEGTFIGNTKRLGIMGPHLHLQLEVGNEYWNSLPFMSNWSDTELPKFKTYDGAQDEDNNPENPTWLRPPIRIVENFDPSEDRVPQAFHDHPTLVDPLNTQFRVPIVHGLIDILARVADPNGTDRLSLGVSDGTPQFVAPSALGFSIQRSPAATGFLPEIVYPPPSEDPDDAGNFLVDTRIDFRRGISILGTPDVSGSARQASGEYTRRLYWFFKEGSGGDRRELGTDRNRGDTIPDHLDYVLTSNAMLPTGDTTSTNPDYFDTNQLPDGSYLPNGNYEIVVRASHIQAADEPLPDFAQARRTVIFCNNPQVTRVTHANPGIPELEALQPGEKVRVIGRNFFSPFYADRRPPRVTMRWGNPQQMRTVDALVPLGGDLGNNSEGKIDVVLPSGSVYPGGSILISVAIDCLPAHLDHPAEVMESAGFVTFAGVANNFNIAYLDYALGGSGEQLNPLLMVQDSLGSEPRLIDELDFTTSSPGRIAMSGDGRRVAMEIKHNLTQSSEIRVYSTTGDSQLTLSEPDFVLAGSSFVDSEVSLGGISRDGRTLAYLLRQLTETTATYSVMLAMLPDDENGSITSLPVATVNDGGGQRSRFREDTLSLSPGAKYASVVRHDVFEGGGPVLVRIDLEQAQSSDVATISNRWITSFVPNRNLYTTDTGDIGMTNPLENLTYQPTIFYRSGQVRTFGEGYVQGISEDGTRLLLGGSNFHLHLLRANATDFEVTSTFPGGVNGALSPDGRFIAYADPSSIPSVVKVYDSETQTEQIVAYAFIRLEDTQPISGAISPTIITIAVP